MLINYNGVPCPKSDTLLRFAEPEVVLAGHSLPQLSILETFRYNKEYELIFGRKVVLAEHSLPQLSILETFRYNKEYESVYVKQG